MRSCTALPSPYIAYPPFSKFCSTPAPHPAPNKTTRHIWCVILLNGVMDLNMLRLVTSTTRTLWSLLCNKVSVYLRSNIWRSFLLVLWFAIIQTNKDTAHIGANRITYPYKCILMTPVLWSQHLSILNSINNKKFTLQSSAMSCLFKNHWLVEVTYQLIRFNKINFFIWNKEFW